MIDQDMDNCSKDPVGSTIEADSCRNIKVCLHHDPMDSTSTAVTDELTDTNVEEELRSSIQSSTLSSSNDSLNSSGEIFASVKHKPKSKKRVYKKPKKIAKTDVLFNSDRLHESNTSSVSAESVIKVGKLDANAMIPKTGDNIRIGSKNDFEVDKLDINGETDICGEDIPIIGFCFSQDLFNIDHLVSSNKCPMCLKIFDRIIPHVKKCAVKRKIPVKTLFQMLKLQKKHDEERQAIGLPVVPEKVAPKRKRKVQMPTTGLGSNLELAIALSKSESEQKERDLIEAADNLVEAGLADEAVDKLKTLEQYGFSSSSTSCDSSGTRKDKLQKTSLLLTRTAEEREKILTEKVAMVILDNEDNEKINVDETEFSQSSSPKSSKLKKIHDKKSNLWNLASVPESTKKDDFYVDSLSTIIEPSNTEPGRLLRHISQVPGRERTPPPF